MRYARIVWRVLRTRLRATRQQYPVVLCTYSFTQATGARGRVNERVRHGLLELVLDVPAGDQLLLWAATPHRPLDGHVSFYQSSEFMARETVSFKAGQCVSYQEVFEAGADLVGSYRCALTIAAPKLELTTGGPPGSALSAAGTVSKVASVATKVAAVAAVGTAVGVAAAAPSKMAPPTGAWVDELESKLPLGSGIRTTLAGWAAAGVSMAALQATFSAAADPQVVVDRLKDAGKQKGLYQMRVVADDYAGLPGVSPTPFVDNSLPQLAIPASQFGVDNPALDLPDYVAQTFCDKAELVQLKPGDKLYRVANDPASDPQGHSGGYWTRTPPAGLHEVVGGTAVVPEWNNFQRVYEFTVPAPADPAIDSSFYAWEGPAACQPVSKVYDDKRTNGYCLPGGDNQLFLPNKFTRSSDFGNHITDVSSQHKSW
jgi:hypothetical protein